MSNLSVEEKEMLMERMQLALERIAEIPREQEVEPVFQKYFASVAEFILQIDETRQFIEQGGSQKASMEELMERNHKLYEDVLSENYDASYANPDVAVERLGEDFGAMLAFLYTEMRSMIAFVYEMRIMELAIRMELFVEVYAAFVYEWSENQALPKAETVRQILYWFVNDYADVAAEIKIREKMVPEDNFFTNIIMNANLEDERYLFLYGEYVDENDLKLVRYMNNLPEETIATMADTYTEGYRIGFEVTNKDLAIKSTVGIEYRVGFERMIRRAIGNFEKMNLKPVIFRAPTSILYDPSIFKRGLFSGSANRQYEFDHKDDKALFFDKNFVHRKLEVTKTAFEMFKTEAKGYAGPAVVETFGEKNFDPVNKQTRFKMSDEQSSLMVEYNTQAGELQRNYIIEEERSFTIIAFPIPEIGDVFEELFDETIRINTLDYKKYQTIQQTIIDALDTADYCEIKGCNGNRTDLRVNLYKLNNPEKETIFENCVADVNIPVGEVFTSPVLEGTNGVLHVSKVYLNELEYRNLAITFKDGMIAEYSCDNFATEEENQAFIKENLLFRHKTLPIGEFAIGTNTTAYVVAKRMNVGDKLPILIAEKMGPHFAVGDTCYSHAEDVKVYNTNGKEIVARDNEVSLLRKSNPSKAYYNCHTDITIPYDELGELTAVRADGTRVVIIENGRFVLEGTEGLNEAFAE